MILLKQSTASQEIPLGYFVDETNGNTEETGLTIANTDIKLWKAGATTLANKNSGGATHISNGIYYAVLDATDTDTLGPMIVFCHVSGALPVRIECCVLAANVYDSIVAATDYLLVDAAQISGDGTAADNAELMFDGTGYAGGSTKLGVDVVAISGDTTAADNAELMFDGTGYAGGSTKLQVEATAAGSGLDIYQAKVTLTDDNSGAYDRYVVVWHKNGMPVTSGITNAKIQIIKVADGTDLVAEVAMTEIASLGMYRYSEGTNRVVNGTAYVAKVTATIDAATRTWYQPVSRDS